MSYGHKESTYCTLADGTVWLNLSSIRSTIVGDACERRCDPCSPRRHGQVLVCNGQCTLRSFAGNEKFCSRRGYTQLNKVRRLCSIQSLRLLVDSNATGGGLFKFLPLHVLCLFERKRHHFFSSKNSEVLFGMREDPTCAQVLPMDRFEESCVLKTSMVAISNQVSES